MATAVLETGERETYLNKEYGIKSWLLTVDHKRIALLYLMGITFFFFIGGFFALLIRLELLTPAGDLVQADTYNKLFTMHGQVMVFFFSDPGGARGTRQLSHPDHDRGERTSPFRVSTCSAGTSTSSAAC